MVIIELQKMSKFFFCFRLEAQAEMTFHIGKCCSHHAEAVAAIAEMAPICQAGRRQANVIKYTLLQCFICESMGEGRRKISVLFITNFAHGRRP
jgi:hypothetical protein